MTQQEFEDQLMSLLMRAHDSKLDRSAVVGCLELCKLTWVLPAYFAMEEMRKKERD